MPPDAATKAIAYTLGEPAGIGTDIIIQLAQHHPLSEIVCVGDRNALQARAEQLALGLELVDYPAVADRSKTLAVKHIAMANPIAKGQPDVANVGCIMAMLDCAIDGCLSDEFSAMITGPVHKGIINDAGVRFSGHTEYLAERTGAVLPVMLLACEQMRVALATTHLPLKEVSAAITQSGIEQLCHILDGGLRQQFGIQRPRILVCGLNPHAGEGGHLGTEEIDVIIPALQTLQEDGIDVVGPLPADTLFTPKYLQSADVVLAMYHDQGLPVLKSQSFGQAANITLGLPIIRTSVDHGTAFDLAGSGKADTGSLQTAISIAGQIVELSRG